MKSIYIYTSELVDNSRKTRISTRTSRGGGKEKVIRTLTAALPSAVEETSEETPQAPGKGGRPDICK